MNSQTKKLVAPAIIVFLVCLYYLSLTMSFILFNMPLFVIVIMSLISFIITGLLIYVLIERIQEIKKGEENDLSQY